MVTARNLALPIHSLPPEILRVVFSLCAETDRQPSGVWHPALPLSHTCSLWRTISLQHPSLWSRVDLSKLSYPIADLILRRGENIPLRIVGCDEHTRLSVIALLPDSAHRLEELSLQVSGTNNSAAILCGIPSVPYPRLTRISLASTPLPGPPGFMRTTILPTPLFGGNTPMLRHLSLSGVRIPFTSGHYCNLSTLKIDKPSRFVQEDGDICWTVRESPNLEHLEISLLVNPTRDTAMEALVASGDRQQPLIALHRLRTVKLNMPFALVHRLLSSIDSDSVDVLQISVTGFIRHPLQVSELLTLPSGLNLARVFGRIQNLSVDISGFRAIHIDCIRSQITGSNYPYIDTAAAPFKLKWIEVASRTEMLPAVAEAIRSRYELPELFGLTLDSSQPLEQGYAPNGSVLRCFLSFPAYKSLILTGRAHQCITYREQQETLPRLPEVPPTLKRIVIRGEVHHDEVQLFWEWCRKLDSLTELRMGSAIMQCYTNQQGLAFLQQVSLRRNITAFSWPKFRFWKAATGAYGSPSDMREEWRLDMSEGIKVE